MLIHFAPLLAALAGEYTSTPVEWPKLSGSQTPMVQSLRSLEDGVRLGGREFVIEVGEDGALLIERQAGARKRDKLKQSGALELGWREDGEALRRSLRFERDHENVWSFGPGSARRFELEGEPWYLVDANLDGEYGDVAADGWARELGGPLLPLTREIIVGRRRVGLGEIAYDGSTLEARVLPINGTQAQLALLSELNDLRAAAGLPGLKLEAELSLGCSEHARYLLASQWDGEQQVKDQEPGAEHASRAGRAAAQNGYMLPAPVAGAAQPLWNEALGRALFLDPNLVAIGISEQVGALCVFDVGSRGTHKRDGTVRWNEVVLAPCDRGSELGAAQAPPLLVRFGERNELTSYSAELWRIDGRKPLPVATEVLEGLSEVHCAGVRPTQKLARKGRYLVVHQLGLNGEVRAQRAVFEVR